MEVVHIPIEIIRQILLNLEVKAVIRFQSVCKEWRSTIQNPHFNLSYSGRKRVMVMAQSSSSCLALTSITTTTTPHIETPFLKTTFPLNRRWSGVWCSCNGLVLFSVGKHILLWNPSTRCCAKVLELPRLNDLLPDVVPGLCYISSTGDYKAVVLLPTYGTRHGTLMVASLKNKEWRQVAFPYRTPPFTEGGLNFRNTLHWRVISTSRRESCFVECDTIVYFEAESDEFKELPSPGWKRKSNIIIGLGIMDNCLCTARLRRPTYNIEVMVMKKYGVKRSWVNKFVISLLPYQFRWNYHNFTLYSLKCNTKVLIWNNWRDSWQIVVYDLKSNTPNYLLGESSGRGYGEPIAMCSYVQSFVSPYEFIWRDDPHKLPQNDVVLSFILERFNI
nr:F-box/kelch-repeat protein At3g23880-like [Ipomoea trifida]